ncbi:hypothetical protein ACOSP7_006930 [Xanthoceras sorbifolium]
MLANSVKVVQDPICKRCGKALESIPHALFWCSKPRKRVSQQSPSVAESLSWIPPPLGNLKLNTDVAVKVDLSFIVGEALALREGLLFVQSLSLFVEWIESDAINVVNAILDMEAYLSFDGLMINDVKALCKSVGVVHCQAISRKRNGLAYTLAFLACSSSEILSWFNVEPSCIFSLR